MCVCVRVCVCGECVCMCVCVCTRVYFKRLPVLLPFGLTPGAGGGGVPI
jgi:hypothetical protein